MFVDINCIGIISQHNYYFGILGSTQPFWVYVLKCLTIDLKAGWSVNLFHSGLHI